MQIETVLNFQVNDMVHFPTEVIIEYTDIDTYRVMNLKGQIINIEGLENDIEVIIEQDMKTNSEC